MIGRPRNPADAWMPPKVYRHPSGFIYKPIPTRSISIARKNATPAEVWAAYNQRLIDDSDQPMTFSRLLTDYFKSMKFAGLAEATRKSRQVHFPVLIKAFGHLVADDIEPHHLRQYMDERAQASRASANNEMITISSAFAWGFQNGKVKRNPAIGVSRLPPVHRDRYVTDQEYVAIYQAGSAIVKVAMELAYLCAMRTTDVLKLRWSDITHEGIYVEQKKTGKRQIKAMTARLQHVLDMARGLTEPGLFPLSVVCNHAGMPVTSHVLWHAFDAARKKAGVNGMTFHDLKAKGISDFTGTLTDKQHFSGHKDLASVRIYDRALSVSPTLDRGGVPAWMTDRAG